MTDISDALDACRYLVGGLKRSITTSDPHCHRVELGIGGHVVIEILDGHDHDWKKVEEYSVPVPNPHNPITLFVCSVEGCEAEKHRTQSGRTTIND